MSDQTRLAAWTPLAVGISAASLVAIMVWFQARDDLDILGDLRSFDRSIIPAALALHMLMHILWATRLKLLAGGLGVPLGPAGAWRLATAGQFAGAVTPGRFGAEALRLSLLVRSGASGVRASRTVLADRSTDMVFFLGAGTVGALLLTQVFGTEAIVVRTVAWVAVGALLSLMLLMAWGLIDPRPLAHVSQRAVDAARGIARRPAVDVSQRIHAFFLDVRAGVLDLLRDHPMRVAAAIVLSIGIWASEFGVLWFVLQGFGHALPYPIVFAAGIMLTILAPVAVSPGGAGVVEVAAVVLLSGLTAGLTPVFVLVWRALTYYYDVVVGGIVAAWQLRRRALS